MPDAVGWRRAMVVFMSVLFDSPVGSGNRAKRCLSEDPAPAAYSALPKVR
jgi:hypothetical protein